MATTRMLLAGFGGQGVLLIGQMIAYSAMCEEKEVTWMPYGPECGRGTQLYRRSFRPSHRFATAKL